MGCFGLYTDEGVAHRMAGGETSRHVVPATIDGKPGWAVVDSVDRESAFTYDSHAEPGHRLTRRTAGGELLPAVAAEVEVG